VTVNLAQGPGLAGKHASCVYENEIPSFARQDMERLYQNTFASAEAEHVRQPGTHTYVAWTGAVVVAVILFHLNGAQARVLNAAIEFDAQALECFAACLFARYPALRAIALRSVSTGALSGRYPLQKFRSTEDVVLNLPPSVDAYMARLGSAGKRLEYFTRKIRRRLPDFRHAVYEAGNIDPALVRSLLALKLRRNADQLGHSALDAAQLAWLQRVVAAYGFVAVATVDGQVCAGAICTRVRDNYFVHVIVHDPAFDAWGIGIVNTYLTILAAIERGGRECHFLWGLGGWKFRFLGEPRALYDMVMYRSRLACMACVPTVLDAAGRAWYWRLKADLRAAAARHPPIERAVAPWVAGWRRLRQAGPRMTASRGSPTAGPVAHEP